MARSSRCGAHFTTGNVAHSRDSRTTIVSDAVTLTSGDNGGVDTGRLAVGAALGMAAVGELAARLVAGTTVRAGLAAAQVTHTGVSLPVALLMCACCLLATLPATLLRPLPSALTVCTAAVISLVLFGLVTVAGAAALVLVAYRLALGGLRLPAVALTVPLLGFALAVAAFRVTAGVALTHGLSAEDAETRVLAVLLASAIPVAALAGMARRAEEERRSLSARRELTEGVLAEHMARGERARIARELHDVVAHHISMIAVQAETARLTTPGLTAAGAQRFAGIGDTARAGLTEMRRLLGVLREDAQADGGWQDTAQAELASQRAADRHPQPGLSQLGDLVDRAREASGSTARLIVSGPVAKVDAGVELAAYRIVQEALTNARRHAPGAAVDVELRYSDEAVWLRIRDNGPGCLPAAEGTEPSAGHGLVGMRERAATAGGSLHAGNAIGGGFCVEAELPAKAPDLMTGAA
jgi:signal transduction histidine kinase